LIGRLTGCLIEKEPGEILLDAGGVGYRVSVPLSTFGRLPATGEPVTLSVHTHVREDSLALYGFDTRAERDLFEKLIGVPGIGPRLAMAVLSHLDPADLVEAARSREISRLTRVPGIGTKTAERLLLELGTILRALPGGAGSSPAAGRRGDLVSALGNLGYKPAQVAPVIEDALAARGETAPF
jgi:holliday junction DNA helicase RuvA